MTKEDLREVLEGDEALVCPDLEDALVGCVYDKALSTTRAVYDRARCVEIRMKQGMSHEEAEEFQSFNTDDAYVGPKTPLFINLLDEDERLAGSNLDNPVIHVRHAKLTRCSENSEYRSECPVCKLGVLCVTRDSETLKVKKEDRCLLCGQRFVYDDL